MLSPEEVSLQSIVTVRDLQLCLNTIYPVIESLWAAATPRIVKDFTDHGVDHYSRIARYATNLRSANKGADLTPLEMFLLLGGIYLHDIGMQCDLTTEDGKAIKQLAERLGANFTLNFNATSANEYSKAEQKEVRKNHHFLSAAWIEYAFDTGRTALGTAAKTIPYYLVPDLMDICLHHTSLPIGDCKPTLAGGDVGRKRLVAALLRFSDELDIDATRVHIEAVTDFSVNPENSIFWWLHNLTRVSFSEPNTFKINVLMRDNDYSEFGEIVQKDYLDRFRLKNKDVLDVLHEHNIPIVIDADGGVLAFRTAPELPSGIKNALRRMEQDSSKEVASDTPTNDFSAVQVSLSNTITPAHGPATASLSEVFRSATERPFIPYGSDLPPVADAWVGRREQIEQLLSLKSGVVAVTGIGGQGKSTLVATFLERHRKANPQMFWDWRDFREQGDRFHTQLIALIEHLTGGNVMGSALAKADTKSVVRYLFELTADTQCTIVLDNVDNYVDLADESFNLGVDVLVQEALRVQHNMIFLLTCRPRVSYANPRFFEIHLEGLSLQEAKDLFGLRGINCDVTENSLIVSEIWSLTQGHPLWLNLLAVQISRNLNTVKVILRELRKGQIGGWAFSMFSTLWEGLNDRQQTILRYLAEVPSSESLESIQKIVGSKIPTFNQFDRAFRGLRALNLVVERRSTSDTVKYDLHPLVRNYIRQEFKEPKERLTFIGQILIFFATFTKGMDAPADNTSLDVLERWTGQAELQLASHDAAGALSTLRIAEDQLIARGFHEEFFRVAKLLFDETNWFELHSKAAPDFYMMLTNFIKSLVEHGRERDSRSYIQRYKDVVGVDTVDYVMFCYAVAYVEWFLNNFDQSIEWAEMGRATEERLHLVQNTQLTNTLALALRDSGRWDDALRILIPDETVQEVIKGVSHDSNRSADFYGNVGRCLQFKGQVEDALVCYVKSANILLRNNASGIILNRGYAFQWIGEALEFMRNYDDAYLFYKRSISIWSSRASFRVQEPKKNISGFIHLVSPELTSITDDEIEIRCLRWLRIYLKSCEPAS